MPKPIPPSLYSKISEIIKPYSGLIEFVNDDHFFSIKEKRVGSNNYFYIHTINSGAVGFMMKPIEEYDLREGSKSNIDGSYVCEQLKMWCEIIDGYSKQNFTKPEINLEKQLLNAISTIGRYSIHKDIPDEEIAIIYKLEAEGYIHKIGKEYKITKEGSKQLKKPVNNIDKTENKKQFKDVFITYSWDNEQHKTKALALCEHLRKQGFNAEMDRLKSQQESATDFSKMMHQAMTDYKKVIVVLSEGYKEKAENFEGGVGKEYQLIIKDIEANPKKYILYTFDKISNDIAPLALKEREIISYLEDSDYQKLYSKLNDEPLITFSEVGREKPKVVAMEIPTMEDLISIKNKEYLDITIDSSLIDTSRNAVKFNTDAGIFNLTDDKIVVIIKNISDKKIDSFNLEVQVPKKLTKDNQEGRIEEECKIFAKSESTSLFAGQSREVECGNLLVTNESARIAFESEIKVVVFSEYGKIEKAFPINGFIKENKNSFDPYGEKEILTLEDFDSEM